MHHFELIRAVRSNPAVRSSRCQRLSNATVQSRTLVSRQFAIESDFVTTPSSAMHDCAMGASRCVVAPLRRCAENGLVRMRCPSMRQNTQHCSFRRRCHQPTPAGPLVFRDSEPALDHSRPWLVLPMALMVFRSMSVSIRPGSDFASHLSAYPFTCLHWGGWGGGERGLRTRGEGYISVAPHWITHADLLVYQTLL